MRIVPMYVVPMQSLSSSFTRLIPLSSLVLAMCFVASCAPQIATPRFGVTFSLKTDEGLPLSGATVSANDGEIGTSSADGIVQTILEGPEGTPIQITWRCPTGYRQPAAGQELRLTQFSGVDSSQDLGLSMTLECAPQARTAAFVVRTNNRVGIPVMLNDREVARTNETGVATFVQPSDPNREFRIVLQTSGHPRLSPTNPYQVFTLGDRNNVFVMDQEFEEAPLPTQMRRRRRRRRRPNRGIQIITRLN